MCAAFPGTTGVLSVRRMKCLIYHACLNSYDFEQFPILFSTKNVPIKKVNKSELFKITGGPLLVMNGVTIPINSLITG